MIPKILSLNEQELTKGLYTASKSILHENADSIENGICFVAIASAGVPIVNIIEGIIKDNYDIDFYSYELRCSRPSKKIKSNSSLLSFVIKKLPSFVNNILRMLEHLIITSRLSPKRFIFDNSDLKCFLSNFKGLILIVDDAIDTGNSFKKVFDYVSLYSSDKALIKSFALTQTQKNSVFKADYTLYNGVLIKGPWSLDMKSRP